MSGTILKNKINETTTILDDTLVLLLRHTGKLSDKARVSFENICENKDVLLQACNLIDYRESCWDTLIAVRDNPDFINSTCDLMGIQISFDHARNFSVQAYLAATWSVSDVLSSVVGSILCTDAISQDKSRSINIWQHFIKDTKASPKLIHDVLRECFAWPIALSYIIRNLFIHEGGGVKNTVPFFESDNAMNGFKMSVDTWKTIKASANKLNVNDQQMRVSSLDPTNTLNLDIILKACNQELDDALGILLISGCQMVLSFATMMTQ
jgi:hypothetical protein